MTKDKQIIIFHDNAKNTTLRTLDKDYDVTKINYDELPLYKKNLLMPYTFGKKVLKDIPDTDRKIPLLEDLFKEFPAMLMNIELKTDDIEAATILSDLIKNYNRSHLTALINGKKKVNAIFR